MSSPEKDPGISETGNNVTIDENTRLKKRKIIWTSAFRRFGSQMNFVLPLITILVGPKDGSLTDKMITNA